MFPYQLLSLSTVKRKFRNVESSFYGDDPRQNRHSLLLGLSLELGETPILLVSHLQGFSVRVNCLQVVHITLDIVILLVLRLSV